MLLVERITVGVVQKTISWLYCKYPGMYYSSIGLALLKSYKYFSMPRDLQTCSTRSRIKNYRLARDNKY